MLSFDLRTLDRQALPVHGELSPDDPIWEEGDEKPSGAIVVTGRLSSAGAGRYYWAGRIAGAAACECRRCLEHVRVDVTEEAHVIFAEAGDAETRDDPDVYPIDPHSHELDLRPAVREQWLLARPILVECRKECRGLCPTCGANLNNAPCRCAPPSDNRWDALRTLRTEPQ